MYYMLTILVLRYICWGMRRKNLSKAQLAEQARTNFLRRFISELVSYLSHVVFYEEVDFLIYFLVFSVPTILLEKHVPGIPTRLIG